MAQQETGDKPDKTLSVTVRTPAGASHPFELKDNTRADKAIRTSVDYFVGTGELAEGEYGLALVRDGAATPLADDARLGDAGVVDGDVLHLTNKGPQVDG